MIDPVINIIVMILFGLIIGATLQLIDVLSGGLLTRHDRPRHRQWRSEGGIKKWWKDSMEAAEEGRKLAAALPRSSQLAMAAFYGLLLVLVLMVKFGPVEMKWWPFLGALLVGFVLMKWLFAKARAGKLRAAGRSMFDTIPGTGNANRYD